MPTHVQAPSRGTRTAPPRAVRLVARSARGQALVEFAAVLVPVMLIVVGIVQFGLLLGANVTLTNATREGARAGTIYIYDRTHTKGWNDAERCGAVATAAMQAFGILSTESPHFSVTFSGDACPTPLGDGQTNGDLTITYCDHVSTPDAPCPDTTDSDTVCVPETREACLMRITLTYRSDIIVPFLGALLSTDGNGRFVQSVTATMVVN